MDLRNFFRRKPQPLPHIVFSRSKAAARKAVEADTGMTSRLVAERLERGQYVPAYFRSRQEGSAGE